MTLRDKMKSELENKNDFELAKELAYDYIDNVESMDVFPSKDSLRNLKNFDENLPDEPTSANEILIQLHKYGAPATTAHIGGRYFGFVDGGAIPASLAVKWLSDVWDQCGGLFNTSPINSKMEEVCESWLKDIFKLPQNTVAGFVSGTSAANLCAVAAARYHILNKNGWNLNKRGLNGSPKIRLIAHEQTHASIKRTLSILGYGSDNVEWIPSDSEGRLVMERLPKLDGNCIIFLQAGNANSGSFDNFDKVCDLANKVGAWVHIDGAFGLWAAASESLRHLTTGIEKASSWAVDGHKTLNTPYDCGIVLCREPKSLITAMQATGEYLVYSEHKDPILYTTEMSKRSRAIELWSVMKYLGKNGIDELITTFHTRAKQLEKGLKKIGYNIVNDVVFNQVMVSIYDEESTKKVTAYIQNSGVAWLGGSTWNGRAVIRISVCSWMTSEKDISTTIELFDKAKSEITKT